MAQGNHQIYGHIRCMIRFWPTLGIFKQGNHQIYGHIRCMIRFWPALGMFGTGKSPNIRSHMVYVFIRYSWQGNYQIYGHIQCVIRFWPTLGIFGREITKYTVTYGLCIYTVFLAGKSPNIRSHTVQIYGSGQPYMCNCIST